MDVSGARTRQKEMPVLLFLVRLLSINEELYRYRERTVTARLIIFLDDGGVMNDNNTRALQWQRLVSEFFAPLLGGPLTRGPARTGWSLTACSTLVPGEGESRPIPITAALSAPTRWSGCGACASWWGSGLLCWLLGSSVHKIGKLRRDNLSSSTSPSPRDAPPSNVRSSKALLHEYESTGLSNKAEGWPVLSARRRKTGRECTNTLSGTPWLHALSIVYAALR